MINRETATVEVITYNEGLDKYGINRRKGSSSRFVDMVIKTYSQSNVNDARYVDATNIGLTADKEITTKNQIKFQDDLY